MQTVFAQSVPTFVIPVLTNAQSLTVMYVSNVQRSVVSAPGVARKWQRKQSKKTLSKQYLTKEYYVAEGFNKGTEG